MIRDLSQVLLDVEDVSATSKFWQEHFGFQVVNTLTSGDQDIVELGAHIDAETTLVIQKKTPGYNQNSMRPSLVYNSNRFDELYETLSASIEVGEIKELHGLRTFTFKDLDEHVFLIKEATQLKFE